MPSATNPDDGVRIHFQLEGSGPPLVLCHGFTGSLEDWRIFGFTRLLASDFQLILLDARGHGDSDAPHDPAAYAAATQARDVVSVLASLNIERAHFHGYSMGGRIGCCIAKYAPQRFTSLTIGGAHPYREDPERWRRVAKLLERGMEYFVTQWEADGAYFQPDKRRMMLACDPLAMRAVMCARADSPRLDDMLTSTQLPTLFYAGSEDELVHAHARRASEEMPNATFVSLPELGHLDASHRADLVVPPAVKFLTALVRGS